MMSAIIVSKGKNIPLNTLLPWYWPIHVIGIFYLKGKGGSQTVCKSLTARHPA
ncbi:Uncharacterised protein [Serratia marcescens]|nr:Uncharacterised protein [Serratia marcescens]